MIEASNVRKNFGARTVVGGVSFSVGKGEVLGFLGPNGAGKSTTMRMITGFLPLSAGKITIGGYDIEENPVEAKQLFGYLPENAPAYQDMTVAGFLDFSASIRRLSGKKKADAIARAVKLCHLEGVLQQTIDTLSKGYHHRVGFAQAILHDPPVLILDEPTDGLDPNQKHEMRELIREMSQTKAIIVSTHILEEVEEPRRSSSPRIFWRRSRRSARGSSSSTGENWFSTAPRANFRRRRRKAAVCV